MPIAAGSRSAVRSGSSAGPEAAACWPGGYRVSDASRAAGPGEDRHLTRVGRQYAPGSAGQGLARRAVAPARPASRRAWGLGQRPKV